LSAATANKVRIGGGEWRSRLLRFPDALALRPTPDRVRQTLFNWLGQELPGQHCLDLFAGSGALGFESLSRGAASATLVEQNPAVYKALESNAASLQAARARLVRMDAMQFLAGNAQPFDVIFLDPPFGQGWLEKILPQIGRHLSADGRLYVEAESALPAVAGWTLLKHSKAGSVHAHLLKCADER